MHDRRLLTGSFHLGTAGGVCNIAHVEKLFTASVEKLFTASVVVMYTNERLRHKILINC